MPPRPKTSHIQDGVFGTQLEPSEVLFQCVGNHTSQITEQRRRTGPDFEANGTLVGLELFSGYYLFYPYPELGILIPNLLSLLLSNKKASLSLLYASPLPFVLGLVRTKGRKQGAGMLGIKQPQPYNLDWSD